MFKHTNKLMKTNYLFAALLSAALLSSCSNTQEKPETLEATATAETEATAPETAQETFAVNADNSTLNWKGVMLNVKSHQGTLKIKEGSLQLEGDKIIGGNFVADLTSITPTDDAYDKEHTKEKLVGHLSSPDFFATDSFPTATFVITSAEANTLKGNLTVKGKTSEEEVKDVVIEKNGSEVKATGKLIFDRQKYGVSYKTGMKDMVLSDDIELDIVLVGNKQ
jgi:polyisoprenoid-binding protein YceI